ncbi:Mu transposase C-terminal domain-containing protein [Deinococcus cellulosilyticus]|uniref:Integrase catalytic domain-containing protein n=1 Tax=Deinococcus cellulosilyticus (strain DSM 18568 / NBRC 106333 / KACC 11606 / 5516J-15) TaxID=1223518 RepID=A0A511N9Q2_DEIC1|nr:Mu transposase C-terminal domain-containing protein [Deinococcus cellulosilyticus]GEM49554.1 hypothetical protein DC3_51890 [Deinococcus cellulosilyticus NBRC 106333 = KACC 11606]
MTSPKYARATRALEHLLPYFRERGSTGIPKSHEAKLCQQAHISVPTLRRYYKKFLDLGGHQHAVSIPDFLEGRKTQLRKHTLSPEVEQLLQTLIDQHWLIPLGSPTFRPYTLQAMLDLIHDHCTEKNLPKPSYNTLKNRLQRREKQDPKKYARLREGEEIARSREPRLGVSPERHFGERIQMDGTLLDFFVRDGKLQVKRSSNKRPQVKSMHTRYWITVAVDEGTSLFLNFSLTEHTKSAFETLRTLRGILLNQKEHHQALGVENTLPPLGIPKELFTDRGSEFVNHSLKRFCLQYGVTFQAIPSAPHLRGRIERLIGLINEALRHLPGSTLNRHRMRGKTGQDYACFGEKDLERYLTQYLLDRLNVQVKRGETISRLQNAWVQVSEGKSQFTPIPAQDHGRIQNMLLPCVQRSLQKGGVQWKKRHYVSFHPDFLNLVRRRKGLGEVTVLFDPHNIQQVWLIHPETQELLELFCKDIPSPTSVWRWEEARKQLELELKPARSAHQIYHKVLQMQAATPEHRPPETQAAPEASAVFRFPSTQWPRFAIEEAPPPSNRGRG